MPISVAVLAQRTLKVLERDGWCKGVVPDTHERCLVLAAADISSSPATIRPFINAVAEVIGQVNITGWNDAPERTYQDVVDVLVRLGAKP